MTLEVVPAEVGELSRAWDQQHLDLEAAATQVAGADVGGFTPGVLGAATGFVRSWGRTTTAVGATCEAQADGLRAAIAAYLASDDRSALAGLLLDRYLQEQR